MSGPRDVAGGRSAVGAYQGARRVNQVARIVGENAEQSVGRAGKNRLFGLQTSQAAQIGATVAGTPGAIAGGIMQRFVSGRGAAARATGAEVLARITQAVEQDPQMFARWPGLVTAARQGGSALAAEHYVLSRTDPDYREITEQGEQP